MAQIKITKEEILSKEHSVLKQYHFDIQKKDGGWENQKREVFDHGNAVTALLYNTEKRKVILTKQFRIATYVNGNKSGMLLETCAGLLEEGEQPDAAMIREIKEETGYELSEVHKLFDAYSSPGAYAELVHYYLAPYTESQKVSAGGGLEEEGEEVKVVELSFEEAWQMMEKGEVKDAKSILLLQQLKLREQF